MFWIYWVLIIYWVAVSSFLVSQVHKCFSIYLQAYKNLPIEIKDKYQIYMRVEHAKLNKFKFILAALTTGVVKLTIFVVINLSYILIVRIICFGADPEKPYLKWRRNIII